jgi:hypothetical protein
VGLGSQAVNARVGIDLPHDRWLLLTGGPRWGPAILLWGYLLIVLLAAQVLVRLPHNPLTIWQWVLLGLGLTQVPALVALIVVSWFFLLAYRKRWGISRPVLRNLAQLGVALWTVVFLGCLIAAVYGGLVGSPDMQVAGPGNTSTHLGWYVDRVAEALPRPWVLSAPLWLWRALMLAWALWLAYRLVRWLRWGWSNFAYDGLWRKMQLRWPKRRAAAAAAAGGGTVPTAGPAAAGEAADDEPRSAPPAPTDEATEEREPRADEPES